MGYRRPAFCAGLALLSSLLLSSFATAAEPAKEEPFTWGRYATEFEGAYGSGGITAAGKRIFTYYQANVELFDSEHSKPLWKLHVGKAQSVAFSADGRWCAVSYGERARASDDADAERMNMRIWNAETREPHKVLNLKSGIIACFDFSPDGRTLAIAEAAIADGTGARVSLWDVESCAMRSSLPIHTADLTRIKYSPDGRRLAFCGSGGDLGVWALADEKFLFQQSLSARREDFQFSADGKWLATSHGEDGGGALEVFDAATGERQPWFGELQEETIAMGFSPRGDLFAAASRDKEFQVSFRFWSWPERKLVHRIVPDDRGSDPGVLQFTSDGSHFMENVFLNTRIWRLDHLFDTTLQQDLRKLHDRKMEISYREGLLRIAFPYGKADDRALQELPLLNQPFVLVIAGDDQINDASLVHLGRQKNLVGLDLGHCKSITPASFVNLRALSLKMLDAPGCLLLEDKHVAVLGELTSLETLRISVPHEASSKLDLGPLGKLKNLRELRFHKYAAPTAMLAPLAGLTKLEVLCFDRSRFPDDEFQNLAKLDKLRVLELKSDHLMTGAGLAQLSPSAPLEVLDLDGCVLVNDDGIASVSRFKKLRELDLSYTAVHDRGLSAVAGLTQLERLELPLRFTDAGLAHLAGLTRLRSLDFYQQPITDQGLMKLGRLTSLRELRFWENKAITGTGLAALAGAKQLDQIHLSKLPGLTDEGLRGIEAWTQLRFLSLPPQITGAGIQHLAQLTNLKGLTLDDVKLSDASLAALAKLQKLETLHIRGTPLTDEAIPHLAALKKLSWLSVERTGITPAGKERLKQAFPKSNYLTIQGP